MSTMDKLVETANQQLDEHRKWLKVRILAFPTSHDMAAARQMLIEQVDQIKVRLTTVRGADKDAIASVLWEYPDELHEFLKKALPEALEGGHTVDTSKPTFTAKRI